jgi:hypothetical protein
MGRFAAPLRPIYNVKQSKTTRELMFIERLRLSYLSISWETHDSHNIHVYEHHKRVRCQFPQLYS